MAEKRFSETIKCLHCGNSAPMEKVAGYSQLIEDFDPASRICWHDGDIYELLVCPACNKVTLRSYYWHDGYMESLADTSTKIVYPSNSRTPEGLPDQIAKAYEAALKVRSVEANAYAVLIGRLLEMICDDRGAQGQTLNEKLKSLSSKGEIPAKLVGVADGLRNLRNVSAHAALGNLTAAEVPILDDLTRSILEYVYSAPHLIAQAEERLDKLKKAKKAAKNPVKKKVAKKKLVKRKST